MIDPVSKRNIIYFVLVAAIIFMVIHLINSRNENNKLKEFYEKVMEHRRAVDDSLKTIEEIQSDRQDTIEIIKIKREYVEKSKKLRLSGDLTDADSLRSEILRTVGQPPDGVLYNTGGQPDTGHVDQ